MSRYRKVPAIDSQEQKKLIMQRRLRKNNVFRPPGPFSPVINSETPEKVTKMNPKDFLMETCTNLRGVCKNVRNFTTEMDNLLNSVENILPVVETVATGYTRSLKNKETESEEKQFPDKSNSASNTSDALKTDDTLKVKNTPKSVHQISRSDQPSTSLPSEEEIKAFLNNPLVISLMQTLTQKFKPQQ